jgi:hypothetical protein
MLEIDAFIPNGVVLMLIGIGIGIDNRCFDFERKRASIRPFEPDRAPGGIRRMSDDCK